MPVNVAEKLKLRSDGERQSFGVFSVGYIFFEMGFDSLRGELVRSDDRWNFDIASVIVIVADILEFSYVNPAYLVHEETFKFSRSI
jgi:hypothetical protein